MTFNKIVVFSLLALALVACAGLLVSFQVFESQRYLPVLTKKVSNVVGRPVTIGHLGLGLSWRGLGLDAWPVSMADDPTVTSQPFVDIARVRILPDLSALVLKKQFHISQVFIDSPHLHLIRTPEGNLNISGLDKPSHAAGPGAAPSAPPFSSPQREQKRGAPTSIAIKSMTIKDASISFMDESRDVPLDVWLRGVNIALKDVVISGSGGFQADGNISAAQTTVKDFNIISTILSYILPLGPENIGNLFKGRLKDKLAARDTVIENLQCRFSLHDNNVLIDHAMVQTDIFAGQAQGTIDQGGKADLQTEVYLNRDASDAVVEAFAGFKVLCDGTGRIAMAANLKGVYPHLKYKPDKAFRKKSRKALMEEGGNILGALLGATASH